MNTRSLVTGVVAAVMAVAIAPAAWADDAVTVPTGDGLTSDTADARVTAATVESCVAPELFNPLTAFKDARHYFVAPNGDFEAAGTGGWTLEDGASIVGARSLLGLGGGQRSLQLPEGSSATSPAFCVDLDYPTFRFFTAQLEKGPGLGVDVIYPTLDKGNVRPAADVKKADDDWSLTKDVPLKPELAGKHAGWRLVALRFRAKAAPKGGGDWRVDDVLVDPRMRG